MHYYIHFNLSLHECRTYPVFKNNQMPAEHIQYKNKYVLGISNKTNDICIQELLILFKNISKYSSIYT